MQNRASRADSTSASPSNAGRPLPAGSAFALLNAKPLVAFDSLEFPSLRLGLADPGPVATGRCVMAIGTPGAQTVAAASIAAEFVRPLHLATVPAYLHALALLSLFFTVPRGKLAWGVRERLSKKRPLGPVASLQVRVSVTPSTERREVRALIRSAILRSDDVVADKPLSLTTLRAAVPVSLLHPRCLLLPPALVQRWTG